MERGGKANVQKKRKTNTDLFWILCPALAAAFFP